MLYLPGPRWSADFCIVVLTIIFDLLTRDRIGKSADRLRTEKRECCFFKDLTNRPLLKTDGTRSIHDCRAEVIRERAVRQIAWHFGSKSWAMVAGTRNPLFVGSENS